MAAFDQVMSGIPALDQALDYIRMGDNVVWRVSNLDEFRRFADPFVEQAKKDKYNPDVYLCPADDGSAVTGCAGD